jgi:hypothetical protein
MQRRSRHLVAIGCILLAFALSAWKRPRARRARVRSARRAQRARLGGLVLGVPLIFSGGPLVMATGALLLAAGLAAPPRALKPSAAAA